MDVDGSCRMRGALLAAVGVAALLLASWWWQAEAPAEPPPGTWTVTGIGPDGSPRITAVWQVAPADAGQRDTGAGSVLRLERDNEGEVAEPGYGYPDGWRNGGADEVWAERTRLRPGDSLVRQARLADGEPQLLRFSCTGPGELLVMVTGARAADPMTVGCDGAVAMIEISGTGAPIGVSFSPAGAAPVELAARLLRKG